MTELQQLTYLELRGVWLQGLDNTDGVAPSNMVDLQHLSALTRLADLRLEPRGKYSCATGVGYGYRCVTGAGFVSTGPSHAGCGPSVTEVGCSKS